MSGGAAGTELERLLRGYAEALRQHHPMPGGVIVVVDRQRQRMLVPFGAAAPGSDRAMPVDALFEIGSISKSFTSLLVMQLVEQGELELSDPVTRWLPWVELGQFTDQVTLQHLLSHTAGLIMGGEALPDSVGQAWTLRDRASFAPGTRFHYSNLGYALLGLILTSVTGRPLADLLAERVFAPLGLTCSLGSVRHQDRPRLAPGSAPAFDDRPWAPGDPLASATWVEVAGAEGNVALSGADLGRYLQLLLSDGVVGGQRVVAAETMAVIGSAHAPTGEDVLSPPGYPMVASSRYGLGLNVEDAAGHDCLTHGGGNIGYSSFVIADRTAGLGVGVLTNADGDGLAAHLLARVVHQVLLDDAAGVALPMPGELPDTDPQVKSDELTAGLLGRFTSATGSELHVRPVGRHVQIATDSGPVTGRLWRTLGGRYVTDHPGLRMFPLDPAPDGGWQHGGSLLRPDGFDGAIEPVPDDVSAYVGHFRSWTPWFTNFRIFRRNGQLFLAAPGGVEAPGQDEPLVPLAPGVWRIGGGGWEPERLVEVARVAGRVQILDRDGARYSRTFTE